MATQAGADHGDVAARTGSSDTAGWGRILGGLGLGLLSAVLLVVIWQSYGNLWWLTFVAFVPMYVAQYRVLPRRWSAVPVGLALAGWYLAVGLLTSSVLSLVVIVAAALAFGIVGWLVGLFLRPFAERTGYRWFVVQLPLIWLTKDLLVQNNEIIGTYPWIAYRLGAVPQVIQPVSIVGTPALSFLLHVANAMIALAVLALIDRRWPGLADVPIPPRVLRWSVAIPATVIVIWVATSVYMFHDVSARMGPAVRVAAIQPSLINATPGTLIADSGSSPKRTEEQRIQDQTDQLTAMTRQAAAQGAKIVVWPEETLNYDPRVAHTEWIPKLARETNAYIAMGFTPNAQDGSSPNTALLWNPEGKVVLVYYKTKRVLAEGESFTPGTVYPTAATPFGVLGMIICFDIDFPDGPARREAQSGAQMVIAPSIDVGSMADARTASTVFRAVENRVAMVKADVAWDSVLAAPNGEVIARTVVRSEEGGQALVVADVPVGPGGAPFTRYGGFPFQWSIYCAAAVMFVVMFVSWRRDRGRAESPGRIAASD